LSLAHQFEGMSSVSSMKGQIGQPLDIRTASGSDRLNVHFER